MKKTVFFLFCSLSCMGGSRQAGIALQGDNSAPSVMIGVISESIPGEKRFSGAFRERLAYSLIRSKILVVPFRPPGHASDESEAKEGGQESPADRFYPQYFKTLAGESSAEAGRKNQLRLYSEKEIQTISMKNGIEYFLQGSIHFPGDPFFYGEKMQILISLELFNREGRRKGMIQLERMIENGDEGIIFRAAEKAAVLVENSIQKFKSEP